MRNRILAILMALAASLTFSTAGWAQGGGGNRPAAELDAEVPSAVFPEGWKPCPRCQNNADRARINKQLGIETRKNNPRDLTGVWGWDGVSAAFRDAAGQRALTAEGKKRFAETIGDKAPDGTTLYNKDTSGRGNQAEVNCDPYGWPRLFQYNYGFEFATMPDRVVQYFETNHTHRVIWTDGRKLPADPPFPRWMGWAVGRWEGDTFVVESNGYDDRSWLSQARPDGGWIHSDQMKIVERWRRTNFGTLEAEITVTDPVIYTEPWTVKGVERLVPGAEIGEELCIPSDYKIFNEGVYSKAAGTDK